MATKTANPLPVDGVAGKLTRDQESSLKDMWKELFALGTCPVARAAA